MEPVAVSVMLKLPGPKLPSRLPFHVLTNAESTAPTDCVGAGVGAGAVGVLGVLAPPHPFEHNGRESDGGEITGF